MAGFFLHSGIIPDIIKKSRKREENSVRRFLTGILIAIILLSNVLGVKFVLEKNREQALPVQETTLPEVTQQTVLETTEEPTEQTIPPQTTEPVVEKKTIDTVPLYFQTDYPYVPFSNGTIATSGCSITCLAMIASYMNDQEYTPPQMAYHFGSHGTSNIERLEYGIAQMHFSYERTENVQEVLKALRSGKVAIALMNSQSIFTNTQHFIVLAGMNEAGKFVVNDPIEDHYNSPEPYIRNAYENGMEDYQIMRGFSGAWIFDKKDMCEESFKFDASFPEQQQSRYDGYALTEDDVYTLACFVWAEAGEEPPEVQQAVAEVVLNRLIAGDYPNTVQGVIRQTEFYRAVNRMSQWDEESNDPYLAVDGAMYGPYVLPEEICFYSSWEQGEEEWGQLGSYTFYKSR